MADIKINADFIYPIGSIYMSINSTDPSIYFGGTWERISNGRVLVGVDENDTDFNTAKKTGGSKNVQLRALIGAADSDVSSLGYATAAKVKGQETYTSYLLKATYAATGKLNYNHSTIVTDEFGATPSRIQPYYTCYIWVRTA